MTIEQSERRGIFIVAALTSLVLLTAGFASGVLTERASEAARQMTER